MKRTMLLLPGLCLLLALCACGALQPDASGQERETAEETAMSPEPEEAMLPENAEPIGEEPEAAETAEELSAAEPEERGHYTPLPPIQNGHFHIWEEDETHMEESSCSENGSIALVCVVCGEDGVRALPKKQHSFYWEANDMGHRSMCAVCHEPFSPDTYIYYPHSYYMYGNGDQVCTVCGWRNRLH